MRAVFIEKYEVNYLKTLFTDGHTEEQYHSGIARGVLAARPSGLGILDKGLPFAATDTDELYRWDGDDWELILFGAGVGAGGGGSSSGGGVGDDGVYDLVFSLSGKPASSTTYPWLTFPRSVDFPANFSGSYGTVGTNPTATAVFTVKKNAATVGTISVSTSGVVTFTTSGGSAVNCAAGDRFTLTSPTQDATLADVAFTLAGQKA